MRAILFTASRIVAFALVFALATVSPSAAQENHTVRIQDGVVFVDGEKIPADQLPESLRPLDHQILLTYTGAARFHLGGVQYGIENGRLVEVPDDRDDVVRYFSDDQGQYVEIPRGSGVARRFRLDGPFERSIGTYLQVLDEHADEFEKLGEQLSAHEVEGTAEMAIQLREEAEQAAIMVRAFPRVEVQTYLHGLQNRDRSLYDQLIREQRMEVASSQLARRIFLTPDRETRESLTETLRNQLEEIFELKQQNRREEVAQLELQLRELREQLAAREANRDAIIARRLESLVGDQNR